MLNRTELRAYLLSKTGAVEDFPFGDEAAVFKVGGKMFALMPVSGTTTISLKCDPTLAVMLRDTYPAVTGAYHMNKKHWNGVAVDGSVPDDEVLEWIDHSYDQVVKGLPKAQRTALEKK
jgi:predicted DNA-binding protein (MmcQ/YjbR family)